MYVLNTYGLFNQVFAFRNTTNHTVSLHANCTYFLVHLYTKINISNNIKLWNCLFDL